MFIVKNILTYHGEKEKKMAGHDKYIVVSSLPFCLTMHHKNKNQNGNAMTILFLLACRLLSTKDSTIGAFTWCP